MSPLSKTGKDRTTEPKTQSETFHGINKWDHEKYGEGWVADMPDSALKRKSGDDYY